MNDQQKQILARRENSFFMLWVYRHLSKDLLTKEERFILCRDCFRLSIFNLVIATMTLPLGMFLVFILLSVIPTMVFAKTWKTYSDRLAMIKNERRTSDE